MFPRGYKQQQDYICCYIIRSRCHAEVFPRSITFSSENVKGQEEETHATLLWKPRKNSHLLKKPNPSWNMHYWRAVGVPFGWKRCYKQAGVTCRSLLFKSYNFISCISFNANKRRHQLETCLKEGTASQCLCAFAPMKWKDLGFSHRARYRRTSPKSRWVAEAIVGKHDNENVVRKLRGRRNRRHEMWFLQDSIKLEQISTPRHWT